MTDYANATEHMLALEYEAHLNGWHYEIVDERSRLFCWWKRISLFAGIVWRINQAEYRTPVSLAWEIASDIWGKRCYIYGWVDQTGRERA